MSGASLVSSFRCNHLNFQTLWFWIFLPQLPFACFLNFGEAGECLWRLCLHLWDLWCPPDCFTQDLLTVVPKSSWSIMKSQGFLDKEQRSHQEWLTKRHGSTRYEIRSGYTERHGSILSEHLGGKSCYFRCTAFRSLGHYYDPRKSQME